MDSLVKNVTMVVVMVVVIVIVMVKVFTIAFINCWPKTRRLAGVGFGKRCHDGSDNSDGDGKSFHNHFYKLLECPLSPKLGLGLRL